MGNFSSHDDVENIPNSQQLTIFRYGSNEKIKDFLKSLDLDNKKVLKELFYASAKYGRLYWLKRVWATIDNKGIDIGNIKDDAFIHAAENGHLDVVEWLWFTYGDEMESDTVRTAYNLAKSEGYVDIQDWILNLPSMKTDRSFYMNI
jgi:hypothetical protein